MLYVPFLLQRDVFTDHSPGSKDGRVSAKVTLALYRHLHTHIHTVLGVCRGSSEKWRMVLISSPFVLCWHIQ